MSRKELKQLEKDLTISYAVTCAFCTNGEICLEELIEEIEEAKLLRFKGHMDGTLTVSMRLPVESWQETVEYFQEVLNNNTMTKGEEEES